MSEWPYSGTRPAPYYDVHVQMVDSGTVVTPLGGIRLPFKPVAGDEIAFTVDRTTHTVEVLRVRVEVWSEGSVYAQKGSPVHVSVIAKDAETWYGTPGDGARQRPCLPE